MLFNVYPLCQDDEDISKIHPANKSVRRYQSHEQENHWRFLCFQARRSRHSRLFLWFRNFELLIKLLWQNYCCLSGPHLVLNVVFQSMHVSISATALWSCDITNRLWSDIKHNILKLLFIEIQKFKKKILEEDEDDSSDQQSDAEQTGNEGNVNDTLFPFLQCSRNCTVPGEGYIGSERRLTGVTDTSTCRHSGNISDRNKKTSMFSQHSNMFNEKQWDFNPVRVFTSTLW